MKHPPRFSILMPTRDRPEWLPRAIASVLAQSFDDWEIVVYDNGATSVEEALPKDERIRYAFGPAAGPADAFQKALDLADGQVIHPLGDDDRLVPNALEIVDREIRPYEWLVGLTDFQNVEGVSKMQLGGPPTVGRLADGYYLGGAVYWLRSLSDRVGGFDLDFDGAADYELYLRFAQNAQGGFVNEVLYLYTDHAGTDSQKRSANQIATSDRIRRLARGGD